MKIKIIATKIVGVAPVNDIVGQIFDAKTDPNRPGYAFIHSAKHGGQIGVRRDEYEIVEHDAKPDREPTKVKQTLANRIAEKVTALVIDPKKQTFIVIGPSYFGIGKTLIAAAVQCGKADCPKSAMVAAVQIVGDDAATFSPSGFTEYAAGAVLVNLGTFKLGHLIAGRETRI